MLDVHFRAKKLIEALVSVQRRTRQVGRNTLARFQDIHEGRADGQVVLRRGRAGAASPTLCHTVLYHRDGYPTAAPRRLDQDSRRRGDRPAGRCGQGARGELPRRWLDLDLRDDQSRRRRLHEHRGQRLRHPGRRGRPGLQTIRYQQAGDNAGPRVDSDPGLPWGGSAQHRHGVEGHYGDADCGRGDRDSESRSQTARPSASTSTRPRRAPASLSASSSGNFPARLKFLRTAATEGSRIQALVTRYSLAYPGVRFQLTIDGSLAFSSPGSGSLREAIAAVYRTEIGEGDAGDRGVRTRGAGRGGCQGPRRAA